MGFAVRNAESVRLNFVVAAGASSLLRSFGDRAGVADDSRGSGRSLGPGLVVPGDLGDGSGGSEMGMIYKASPSPKATTPHLQLSGQKGLRKPNIAMYKNYSSRASYTPR